MRSVPGTRTARKESIAEADLDAILRLNILQLENPANLTPIVLKPATQLDVHPSVDLGYFN